MKLCFPELYLLLYLNTGATEVQVMQSSLANLKLISFIKLTTTICLSTYTYFWNNLEVQA